MEESQRRCFSTPATFLIRVDGYIEKWMGNPERALFLITFKTKKGKMYGPYTNHQYDPVKEENKFTIKNGEKKIIAFYGNNSHDNNFVCRLGAYGD